MNLDKDKALARLRKDAVLVFLNDVVTVERMGARALINGLEASSPAQVYVGPARLVARGTQHEAVEFPVGMLLPRDGDIVTWRSSDNPALVGETRILKVQGLAAGGGVLRVSVETSK